MSLSLFLSSKARYTQYTTITAVGREELGTLGYALW